MSPPQHSTHRELPRTNYVLGINSGTSIDGLDFALIKHRDPTSTRAINERRTLTVVSCQTTPFPPRLKDELRQLAESTSCDIEHLARLHMALGAFTAKGALRFLASIRHKRHKPDLVGMHGQTIGHWPMRKQTAGTATRATLQIAEPSYLAQAIGSPVITDFRPADIAAGGQGAPLSGWYHHLMFGQHVPVLNIGGIANLSTSRFSGGRVEVLAFDTGPGNCLIDHIARTHFGRPYDKGGRIATAGAVKSGLLESMLKAPYFRKRPPKTTDPSEFVGGFMEQCLKSMNRSGLKRHDIMATAAELTARSIEKAFNRWIIPFASAKHLVISGGGVKNPRLVRRLKELLAPIELTSPEDFGFPPKYIEAIGFALLAIETWAHRPGNTGGATGATRAIPLGKISIP